MRKIFLLLLPAFLFAEDFATLLKLANDNLLLKAKRYEITAKEALLRASKAKNYPTLDAKLTAAYLKDEPTMNFKLPFEGMPPKFQVGKKANYTGEINIAYPIFTGYAISGQIEKAKLDTAKTKLEEKDEKRRLYIKIASLYANIFGINYAVNANEDAKTAIERSLEKARGFFKAGLLAPSELENIKAKKHEITASLQTLKNQKRTLLQTLSYLCESDIENIDKLPSFKLPSAKRLLTTAVRKREDILVIKKLLEMDEEDIKMTKSKLYPSLALTGALKLQGDTLKLNGDGYTNPNKSYIAAVVNYDIFDGFETKHRIDAAKAKKMARILYLNDYQKRIKTSLKNKIDTLQALYLQKEAKNAQLKAQKSYYKLTQGRFANHLSSADELSRSVAALAKSRAQYKKIEADIFIQKCKILLESSLSMFEKTALLH